MNTYQHELRLEQQTRQVMKGVVRFILLRVSALLGRGFAFRDTPGKRNASAPICGTGLLHFDLLWLDEMRQKYGMVAVNLIVLHEVGHALDCRGVCDSWDYERYADNSAGQLAALLGYGLEGAAKYYYGELDCGPHCRLRCTTHPPSRQRFAALCAGYNAALKNIERQEQAQLAQAWLERRRPFDYYLR